MPYGTGTESGGRKQLYRVIRNTQNMLKIFRACKAVQLKSGKAEDSPEIVYINIKICEFENDVQVLKQKAPVFNNPCMYN